MSGTVADVRVPDLPDRGQVTDQSRFVAERGGTGTHTAAAVRQYVLAGLPTGPSAPSAPQGGVAATLDRKGLVSPDGGVLLQAAPAEGLYRINYNLLITGGNGAGIGTLTLVIGWYDGQGQPFFNVPALPNARFNWRQGTEALRLQQGGSLSWAVVVQDWPGPGTTTEYSLMLALEKLL